MFLLKCKRFGRLRHASKLAGYLTRVGMYENNFKHFLSLLIILADNLSCNESFMIVCLSRHHGSNTLLKSRYSKKSIEENLFRQCSSNWYRKYLTVASLSATNAYHRLWPTIFNYKILHINSIRNR